VGPFSAAARGHVMSTKTPAIVDSCGLLIWFDYSIARSPCVSTASRI